MLFLQGILILSSSVFFIKLPRCHGEGVRLGGAEHKEAPSAVCEDWQTLLHQQKSGNCRTVEGFGAAAENVIESECVHALGTARVAPH